MNTNIRTHANLSTTVVPGDGAIALNVLGFGAVGIQIAGSFSGTLVFEGSIDGTVWSAVNATPPNSTTAVSSATSTGLWIAVVGGLVFVRVRLSAYASGLAVVNITAVPFSATASAGGGGGGGGGDASAANQLLEIADLDKLVAQVLDYDTGAGTASTVIHGIALPASGGPVAGGTNTNPIQIGDAGGSITVDGTVAITNANLDAALSTLLTTSDFDTKVGGLTETAPATDTASSGLNGRLQRIAQRLTSLITALGSPFQAGGNIGNTAFQANAGTNLNTSLLALETGGNLAAIKTDVDKIPSQGQALAAASTPVVLTAAQITTLTPPAAITGFATETTLGTRLSESDFDTKTGGLTETAPATDTASSGLNGRLQRIAQRLTSLITALGSPFQAGGSIGNTTFTVTQATGTNLHTVTDSGTVTPIPSTTGGWTNSKKAALSNTNSQVKSGAGTLGGWYIYNPNASVAYVQIYDTATGSITVGTTVSVLSIGIPPTSAANLELTLGLAFATAICVAATTAAGNSTAPGTALDCNFWYK